LPDPSSPVVAAALLYQVAQVYAAHGNADEAEKTAQRALALTPGNEPEQLDTHLKTAWALRRRGLFKWAEAEFRRVAAGGMPTATVIASNALAEMFHDQGNNESAAETLRAAVEAFDQKKIRQEELAGRSRHEMVARMHYFSACRAKELGDKASQLKHLEEALRADPAEVDSLIAYYRFPETSPEHRKKAEKLVERALAMMREQIADEPDDPNAYNQFAWLVGNTKGNLDEALKFSKLSLDLSPDNSAYLDTLAHVHFARGELEEAVEFQTKAAELDPHSGLIVKELAAFRAALEAKKKTTPKG
jgi:tetratricopeptide (TPR) repeat protein